MTRKDAEEFLEEIRKRMSGFNGPITAGGRMPADDTTPCPGWRFGNATTASRHVKGVLE